ncbi:MAG TPA: PEGA domain-containing protein [Vicinamibacterales bacterium]|jgi:hypothetical protein
MTRTLAFALPAIIATALWVAPVTAQDHRDGGSQSSGGGAAAPRAPAPAPASSGGSTGSSGGGRTASGGGQSSGGSNGGAHAAPRSGGREWITGRTESRPQPAGEKPQPAAARPAMGGRTASSGSTSSTSTDASAVPASNRPREGRPVTGQAVERPPYSGGYYPPIYGGGYPIYYPWGWGGLAFSGYYGGYYDPWFDPAPYPTSYSYGDEGSLHLKVKQRDAAVYVDGYYAGEVDEFDGVFQRLHLDSGPHRIEITLDGYEPLNFDVRIEPNKTVTYKGEMKRLL